MSRKVAVVGGECYVRTSNLDMSATPYVAYKIKSAHHAVAASLHIMLKHMADMHSLMFDVISEKYKIPYDDIVEALNDDPRVQKMMVEPTIHSLNYFTQEDLDRFQALWQGEENSEPTAAEGGLVEKMEAVSIECSSTASPVEVKTSACVSTGTSAKASADTSAKAEPKEVKPRVIKKKAETNPIEQVPEKPVEPQPEPVQEKNPVKKRIIIKKKPVEPPQ